MIADQHVTPGSHVPADRVVDVNIFDLPGATDDAHRAWQTLTDGPAMLWTPHHGGHWIATSGELIEHIYRTPDIFSNIEVGIPPGKFKAKLLPIQLDGEEHKIYRQILDPAFRPAAVQAYGIRARALAIDLIDGFRSSGHCEFVSAFALVMPLSIFLSIVDLPVEDAASLHAKVRRSSRSPKKEARDEAFQEIVDYLEHWIDRRREAPGDDLLSKIVNAEVNGARLTRAEVVGMGMLLLFAGLDTVAAMMAFVMRHLAEHPDTRRWIIDNPSKVSQATEELMRIYGVANNVRTALEDVELDGVSIRKGEHVVIPNSLHGRDERQFPHAGQIDFHRSPGQTGTFGWGPHRCIGANLARMEMRILLEEWLRRIPDFEIDPETPIIQQSGTVNGFIQLPLRWAVEQA